MINHYRMQVLTHTTALLLHKSHIYGKKGACTEIISQNYKFNIHSKTQVDKNSIFRMDCNQTAYSKLMENHFLTHAMLFVFMVKISRYQLFKSATTVSETIFNSKNNVCKFD